MKAAPLIIILSSVLCASCSVKEDRSLCPVYVTLMLDKFVEQGLNEGGVVFNMGQELYKEKLNFLPHTENGITYPCSKSGFGAAVVSGISNSRNKGNIIYVEKGKEADPIWSFGDSFVISSDNFIIKAEPRKQYCKIKFKINGLADILDYPYRYRIKAGCNGLDLLKSQAIEGEYEIVVYPNSLNEWYVIIPRQKANEQMTMEIFLPDQISSREGKTEYVVDLAKLFAEKAYDWNAESLEDISLLIDYSYGSVSVSIEDWENDNRYSNEII